MSAFLHTADIKTTGSLCRFSWFTPFGLKSHLCHFVLKLADDKHCWSHFYEAEHESASSGKKLESWSETSNPLNESKQLSLSFLSLFFHNCIVSNYDVIIFVAVLNFSLPQETWAPGGSRKDAKKAQRIQDLRKKRQNQSKPGSPLSHMLATKSHNVLKNFTSEIKLMSSSAWLRPKLFIVCSRL